MEILIYNWLSYCVKIQGVQTNTIKAYERDVKKFVVFIEYYYSRRGNKEQLAQVDLSTLRAWISNRKNNNLSNRSLLREISAIKSFYVWELFF